MRRFAGDSKLAFVAFIALAVLVAQTGLTQAKYKGINPFCLKASRRQICTKIVNGATTWKQALTRALDSTHHLASLFQTKGLEYVEAAVATNVPNHIKQTAIKTCREDFESMADYLAETSFCLSRNDTYNAVQTMMEAYRTRDCLKGFHQWKVPMPPVLRRMFKLWEAHALSCLTIIQL